MTSGDALNSEPQYSIVALLMVISAVSGVLGVMMVSHRNPTDEYLTSLCFALCCPE